MHRGSGGGYSVRKRNVRNDKALLEKVPKQFEKFIHITNNGNLMFDLKGMCEAIGVESDEAHQEQLGKQLKNLADSMNVSYTDLHFSETVQ